MPTTDSAEISIIKRFRDNFSLTSTVATVYDNETVDRNVNESWVRISIQFGDETQATMGSVGNRDFRQTGVIFFQLYVEPDTGTKDINLIVDSIKAVWRGALFEGITCGALDSSKLGLVDDIWYQTNVTCEFYYDEFY